MNPKIINRFKKYFFDLMSLFSLPELLQTIILSVTSNALNLLWSRMILPTA